MAHSNEDGAPQRSGLGPESRDQRNDSVSTATEANNQPTNIMKPIDQIDTIQKKDERHDSDNHHMHLADTVKQASRSAGRMLYVHHRHQKDLSKQFTAGSIAKHIPFMKHSTSKVEKPHQDPNRDPEAQTEDEAPAVHSTTFWQNIWIMCSTFPYWNMAFWSGWCYSIGSAMFIIDGIWAWAPQVWGEHIEFKNQEKYGVPLMFFFGACLYQIGGVMAYLEAINDGSFAGAAMKRLLEGHQDLERELLDAKLHTFFGHIVPHHHHDDHHHDDHQQSHRQVSNADPEHGWKAIEKSDSPEDLYAEAKERVERRGGVDQGPSEQGQVRNYLTWRWWPTWHAFRTYHIYEMGYVACAIQLFGVTLYGVTSIVVLPGILDSLAWWQTIAAYWGPQVVASTCFLGASIMFTIMAQDKWYIPKYREVSWWIGLWAQVGSVGFLLSAIFGLFSEAHTWGEYQSSLSSTWGSFFYMMSGLYQWYEAINVNVGPVLAFPNNRTPVVLRKQRD